MSAQLVGDVVVPVATILVSSGIAIWLARSERKAAERDRAAENERRRMDRVGSGVEAAIDAMGDLLEAAYTDDFRAVAKLRLRAQRRVATVRSRLGTENEALWLWVVREIVIVAGGLDDTDHTRTPALLEEIRVRTVQFNDALNDWEVGRTTLQWFVKAEHPTLRDTPMPEPDGR